MMHALRIVAEVALVILGVIVFAGSALVLVVAQQSKDMED